MAQKKTVKKGSATKKNTATKKNGEAKRNTAPKKNNTTKKKVQNTKQTTAKSQGSATSKKTVSKRAQSVTKQKTSPGVIAIGALLIAFGVVALGFMLRFVFMPAAKVNGQVITEAEVCQSVQEFRSSNNLESDENFASYLRSSGIGVSELREQFIEGLIEDKIFDNFCNEYNVSVNDNDVNTMYNRMRDSFYEQYSDTNVSFEEMIKQHNGTINQYKDSIRISLLSDKLTIAMAETGKFDGYAEEYFVKLNQEHNINGVRGFYPLAFQTQEEANLYKQKLDNKEISIEDLAYELASADNNDNINGDVELFALPDEVPEDYMHIISSMNIGDSVVIKDTDSSNTYFLIYVNNIISCNNFTGWDSLFDKGLKEKMVKFYVSGNSQCLDKLIDDEKKNSEIEKYDMPWGIPYDVDINLGKD